MKTLAEINVPRTSELHGRVELDVTAVGGRLGRGTGNKVHMIRVTYVLQGLAPRPGCIQNGEIYRSHAWCGTKSNGQITARPFAGYDTDKVTCESCLKRLGERS